jgi:hypothetical protein
MERVVRDPLQAFADHVGRKYRGTEQTAGYFRDLGPLICRGSLGRHRRRCADALDGRSPAGVSGATYKIGDVGALSPAVGVQLVKDQEL